MQPPDDLAAKVAQLKEAVKTGSKVKTPWVEPTLAQCANGSILVFDQTVNKTGWACFTVSDGVFTECAHGTLLIPDDGFALKGHADTLHRALQMQRLLTEMVLDHCSHTDLIVNELPAAFGHRTESSLLAAFAVHLACDEAGADFAMVANQHMKKVMVGLAGATKAHVKASVLAVTGATGSWNQDNADALALGITWLIDKGRADASRK